MISPQFSASLLKAFPQRILLLIFPFIQGL